MRRTADEVITNSSRRCFLHIGTHKTGSTSLQMLLHTHPRELAARRRFYPRSGRAPDSPSGHHNLAWEISRDPRHQRQHGTLDDLFAEIEDVRDDVILSSEDFECAVFHADAFGEFLARLRANGFDVAIVVYLRNQVDYATSLYMELIKHGLAEPWRRFLQALVDDGQYAWKHWIFPFCYDGLTRQLETFEDVDLVVRAYDQPCGGSLTADFLSIVGLGGLTIQERFDNRRVSAADAFGRFCHNRFGNTLVPLQAEAIRRMSASLMERDIGISAGSIAMVEARFMESNQAVGRKFGIPGFGAARQRVANGGGLTIESVFSEAVLNSIAQLPTVARADVTLENWSST
jgi:hypothetical protein